MRWPPTMRSAEPCGPDSAGGCGGLCDTGLSHNPGFARMPTPTTFTDVGIRPKSSGWFDQQMFQAGRPVGALMNTDDRHELSITDTLL